MLLASCWDCKVDPARSYACLSPGLLPNFHSEVFAYAESTSGWCAMIVIPRMRAMSVQGRHDAASRRSSALKNISGANGSILLLHGARSYLC